jgi:hypothetical protein
MSQVATQVYEFTITLTGPGEFTAELADRLYEAGCDDASFGTSNGVHYGTFHREAASLADALASAVRAVEAVGFKVARVDVEAPDGGAS